MAEFRLPAHAIVQKGGYHYAKASPRQHVRVFQVYRWQAETTQNPRLEYYEIDLDNCGAMVLDAFFILKIILTPVLASAAPAAKGYADPVLCKSTAATPSPAPKPSVILKTPSKYTPYHT